MALTYPLSLPAVSGRRQITIRQRTVVAVSESPFTLQRQVQVHQGQRWEASVQMPPMTRAQAEEWIAWGLALNGPEGTFLMGDPLGAVARGSAGVTPGTPLVFGAGQTGNALNFDGAPAAQSAYLLPGDWIQIGTGAGARLHKVLGDTAAAGLGPTTTNGSGQGTVLIWPRLRSSPADNAPITVAAAKGVFALPPGAATEWSMDEARTYGLQFSALGVV